MKIANRKAKNDRDSRLSALEAYANLGETPEDWKRFRLKHPNFFPAHLTEWLYAHAESLYERFKDIPDTWLEVRPPLLFYRDRLRLVWSLNDQSGSNLKFLYGFEKDSGVDGGSSGLVMPGDLRGRAIIPGQSRDEDERTTVAGLPSGKAIVNGITGAIDWEFGCALQQSVYDLMQQRWRAMVCPECGKFFLADKPNQKFCSPACFGKVKKRRALDYWNVKGSADRKRKAKGGK